MQIPDWLATRIATNCPHCGSEIINNELLTDRYCSNPKCPEHMAHKIDVLAKRFGIKQFGVAKARELVGTYKFPYHTHVLRVWFKEKPSLHLHEIGEICLIKGHQKKWQEYCKGCDTMRQVLSKPDVPKAIKDEWVLLCSTEALCNVKPRMLGRRINVMMSGSFQGYKSRSDFLAEMNNLYGDYVCLVDVGKRKTDVAYLIKETHAVDHEKSAIAASYGIPTITPALLNEKLKSYCSYMIERGTAT